MVESCLVGKFCRYSICDHDFVCSFVLSYSNTTYPDMIAILSMAWTWTLTSALRQLLIGDHQLNDTYKKLKSRQ